MSVLEGSIGMLPRRIMVEDARHARGAAGRRRARPRVAPRCWLTPTLTDDAVLSGRLVLRQPKRGHRFGHDAILLAAAKPAEPASTSSSRCRRRRRRLALALRVPGLTRRWSKSIELAASRDNAPATESRTGTRRRARYRGGARAFAAAGLALAAATHVMMNPPFNDSGASEGSPDPAARWRMWPRRRLGPGSARPPAAGRAARSRSSGAPTNWPMCSGRWRLRRLAVLPVHPRRMLPAIRILVRAVKGSRRRRDAARLTLNDARQPTAEAEAILRGGAAIADPVLRRSTTIAAYG